MIEAPTFQEPWLFSVPTRLNMGEYDTKLVTTMTDSAATLAEEGNIYGHHVGQS